MDRTQWGLEECSSAYVDDVLVYSDSWDENFLHLEAVLQRLKQAGLMAKRTKCEWNKSQLEQLWNQIRKGRLAVPEDRVSAIANYVKAMNKKGVRAFLGLQSFHARLWENC